MVKGARRIVFGALSTVTMVVLLFGYRTSTEGPATTAAPAAIASVTTGGSTSGTPEATDGTADSATASTTTVTGDAEQTQWGPVQVELTIADGAITDVSVPVYPNGNGRDMEINSYALPQLVEETMNAQSADIDMISGATVTSDGYVRSLQSALDKAGL